MNIVRYVSITFFKVFIKSRGVWHPPFFCAIVRPVRNRGNEEAMNQRFKPQERQVYMRKEYPCKWRPTTAGFAELNGRDAELSGHLSFID